jgi:hypothetical protein
MGPWPLPHPDVCPTSVLFESATAPDLPETATPMNRPAAAKHTTITEINMVLLETSIIFLTPFPNNSPDACLSPSILANR